MESFLVCFSGCRSNACDAEALRSALLASGLREDPSSPDVAVFFGCVVTSVSEAKSRKALRRLLGRASRVVAAGCCGAFWSKYGRAPEGVEVLDARSPGGILSFLGLPAAEPGRGTAAASGRTRRHLKVQEGCPGSCSYCVVRLLRPGSVSRPPDEVISETARMLDEGVPEVVLTGVNLGLYGRDLPERTSLAGLVERLLPLFRPGESRLRLSSVEPLELEERLVRLAAGNPGTFAPYFHLPLQSGDDRVLARMGRPYDSGAFRRVVEMVRRELPSAGIGLDVIAGFPGEDDEAFRRTLEMVEFVEPVRTHVFPFSPRPGTAAAALDGRVREDVRRGRAAEAAEAAREASARFAERLAGERVDVVWEKRGGYCGRFLWCEPEVEPGKPGSLGKALVTGVAAGRGHPAAVLKVRPVNGAADD